MKKGVKFQVVDFNQDQREEHNPRRFWFVEFPFLLFPVPLNISHKPLIFHRCNGIFYEYINANKWFWISTKTLSYTSPRWIHRIHYFGVLREHFQELMFPTVQRQTWSSGRMQSPPMWIMSHYCPWQKGEGLSDRGHLVFLIASLNFLDFVASQSFLNTKIENRTPVLVSM